MDELTEMMSGARVHCAQTEHDVLVHVHRTAGELLYFGNAYGNTPSQDAVQWMRDVFVRWNHEINLEHCRRQRRLLEIAEVADVREFLHGVVVFCEHVFALLREPSTSDDELHARMHALSVD